MKPLKLPASDQTQQNPPLNRVQRRAIRFSRVREIIPLSSSRLYQLIESGALPRPFKVTENGHASFFWEHEIYEWLEHRAHASRSAK